MRYKCVKKCQVRLNSKIHLISIGEVVTLDDEHDCFVALDESRKKLDFKTASEAELLETEFTFELASNEIKKMFSIDLKGDGRTSKANIIKQILDARFRAI